MKDFLSVSLLTLQNVSLRMPPKVQICHSLRVGESLSADKNIHTQHHSFSLFLLQKADVNGEIKNKDRQGTNQDLIQLQFIGKFHTAQHFEASG